MCDAFPMFGRCGCWAKRKDEAWRHRRSIRRGYAAPTKESDSTCTFDTCRVPGAEFDAGLRDVMLTRRLVVFVQKMGVKGGRQWTVWRLYGGPR
jgi:hypothetical protein